MAFLMILYFSNDPDSEEGDSEEADAKISLCVLRKFK